MSDPTTHAYNDFEAKPDPPHQPLYLKPILKYLRDPGIKSVLDAGCGDGNFAQSLAEARFEVYGLDLSESGIRRARQRAMGTYAVSSLYDDLRKPFNVASFDAVIAIEVIEHLYSPRIFIQRAHEALAPGGTLVITTPYWGYAKNVILALTGRTDRALTALWDGGHIKHWSRNTLTRLVTEAAFEFVGFEGCGRPIPGLWEGMLVAFRRL